MWIQDKNEQEHLQKFNRKLKAVGEITNYCLRVYQQAKLGISDHSGEFHSKLVFQSSLQPVLEKLIRLVVNYAYLLV